MVSRNLHGPEEYTLVARKTLHMLGVVLQAAFRVHCTGDMVAGKRAWQLVRDVQQRLWELQPGPPLLVSEERLTEFLQAPPDPANPAAPVMSLEDAA